MLSFFWAFIRKLETRIREDDEVGLYKHPKMMKLEWEWDRSSAYVKDMDGILLRDVEFIRERSVRWNRTLLNVKSPNLDPNITEGLDQRPENTPLGIQSTILELIDAVRTLANRKAIGQDRVSVELFKIPPIGDPALRRRLVDIVLGIWMRGGGGDAAGVERCHHHVLHKKKDRTECGKYRGISLVAHASKILLMFIARLLNSVSTASARGSYRRNRVVSD